MNRNGHLFMVVVLGAVGCLGGVVAEDDCPLWLSPRASLENLLKESPTGLFPDFYSSPVFSLPAVRVLLLLLFLRTICMSSV